MEKKFNKPKFEIIQFAKEDIIVTSAGYGNGEGAQGDFWGNDDMGNGN